jgi:hypothetical protein
MRSRVERDRNQRLLRTSLEARPARGRVGFPRTARMRRPRRTLVNLFRSSYLRVGLKLRDSLPHGSCAPLGDGALRRAGGAV